MPMQTEGSPPILGGDLGEVQGRLSPRGLSIDNFGFQEVEERAIHHDGRHIERFC